MAFCVNCGQELSKGTKFCAYCGKPVDNNNSTNQRNSTYEGEIHKCPNCGEILGAFLAVCPSCGHELRGVQSAGSIENFSRKIEQAESNEQKATLICNFPISNTKEDIFEFMILASSSITGECNDTIFNAWLAKIDK